MHRRSTRQRTPRKNIRGDLRCSHCRHYLPPDHFHNVRTLPHGKSYACKECRSKMVKRYTIRMSDDRYQQQLRQRNTRRKEKRDQEIASRHRRAQEALAILARKGLSRGDVAFLCGFNWSVLARLDQKRYIQRRSVNRLERLSLVFHLSPVPDGPRHRRKILAQWKDDHLLDYIE